MALRDLAARRHLEGEGLVRRQAERPGQGSAPGLLRVRQHQQRPGLGHVVVEVQVIAGMQHARRAHPAALVAVALHVEVEIEVVDAAHVAERRGHLDPGAGLVDVEGNRQPRVLALLGEGRPPKHFQRLDVDAIGVEVSPEQFDVTPRHVEVIRLQPHAALVTERDLADADVAPDIAAQPFDLQSAEPSDLESVGAGLDQQAGLRQQHPVACADQGERDQRQERQSHGHDGLRQGHAPAGGNVFRRAQKLCPMLT